MMSTARSRYPFTASQWQELEHQALIFKYMVSGMPVPPDLLYNVRRSLDSSISSNLLLHQSQLGWNCFQMGFGRKIDPEPGRCRRTDGKKWRCSKEAYPDSKYCERHMHRGRNRSRKPVELMTTPPPPLPTSVSSNTSTPNPPIAISLSSISKATNTLSPSSPTSHHSFSRIPSLSHSEPHPSYTSSSLHFNHTNFPYSHHLSSSRSPGNAFASQENSTNNFLLDSGTAYSHGGSKGYCYGQRAKEEIDHEHEFLSGPSGPMRNISGSSMDDSCWQLAPLTMGSPLGNVKQQKAYSGGEHCSNYLQLQSLNDHMMTSRTQKQQRQQQFYPMGACDEKNREMSLMLERDDQPKKVMHDFFDEWPPKDKGNSWLDSAADHDKFSSHVPVSKIQLSISMPNSSHDFFMTRNDK